MAFILTAAAVSAALIVSGCSGTPTATPTATPAPTATPTPTPTLSPVDREYQFVERLYVGINDHNAGVGLVNTAKNLFNQSDYANASRYMGMAGDRMDVAKNDFNAMLGYATTNQEITLSQMWIDTADNYAKSYHNSSDAYAEYAYQMARPVDNRNFVKYNYFVEIANSYNALAGQSRRYADATMGNMTFIVPTSVP